MTPSSSASTFSTDARRIPTTSLHAAECPFKVQKSRTSAAAQRANSTSIYARPYTTDLGPVTLKRDHRKEMSSLNVSTNATATSATVDKSVDHKDDEVRTEIRSKAETRRRFGIRSLPEVGYDE